MECYADPKKYYGVRGFVSGEGVHTVYAGGWALNKLGSFNVFIDKNKGINTGLDVMRVMFEELFKLNVNGYTIYAHNLGRYDSVYIVKLISLLGYKVEPLWRDNGILKVKIKDINSKKSITLLDSLNLFKAPLKVLLESFDCSIVKGVYPHLFVNENNLDYVGAKPGIEFFQEVSLSEYNDVPSEWNLKNECLKYLDCDVHGLLEAMNKANDLFYSDYSINITKYMTLPALSLAIFGLNFYDESKSIKMIKGPLEKMIREAYFGGNVGVYGNWSGKGIGGPRNREIHNVYHYDMNSQFPTAMVNRMPTGNPVFSTNTNLDDYFGFVYAEITPPRRDELENLFIQYRDIKGKVVCPREPFYRWIASFELKQALEYGYKGEIICGINFPDAIESDELFSSYVRHFFEQKRDAKDKLRRSVAKLMLNSLYGKFGQKDIESRIRLVSRKVGDKLIKKHHYSYFSEISEDLVLIKYGARLNEKIRLLYKDDESDEGYIEERNEYERLFKKERGMISAVQISCAITAYARMSINIFKNIPDNKLYYSDTDSLVLQNPLPKEIIGKELGEWKLEAAIKKGIFIRPKLYAYYTDEDKLIKVASGVDSKVLSYYDYLKLSKGKSVITYKMKFSINWYRLEVETINQRIILRSKLDDYYQVGEKISPIGEKISIPVIENI